MLAMKERRAMLYHPLLEEKEKELKELNDALEPSNGVQRSPSLNRLHSEEGENLAVTLERMRGISETLEPAPGDGD